jgi:hypothetical protein
MIRIVSCNIKNLLGKDAEGNFLRLGEKLKSLGADIYAIQGCDAAHATSLGKLLQADFNYTAMNTESAEKSGLATFSNLKKDQNFDVKIANLKENNYAQVTRFRVKNSVFDFVNLYAPKVYNKTYWKNFQNEYDFSDCVLSGSFNLEKDSESLQILKQKYSYLPEAILLKDDRLKTFTFIPKKSFKILNQESFGLKNASINILITTLDLW